MTDAMMDDLVIAEEKRVPMYDIDAQPVMAVIIKYARKPEPAEIDEDDDNGV